METALFGGGCFWCLEAVYNRLNGVENVVSGYAGGLRKNPSYENVCTGATGHAEVVKILFDPSVVSYNELLDVFWKIHNPTTLNAQGADKGTQYRSVIFYLNDDQREKAEQSMRREQQYWSDPIVTEIKESPEFFPAEEYHQNYYDEHPTQGYCHFVITPKIEKFTKLFSTKVKS